eukprot:EC824888.1.p1 GENE.EC824888.1~~EC824888.1.p1  ORF type:complete len:82 (-),score=42.60 EC824888.1:327-572(-)
MTVIVKKTKNNKKIEINNENDEELNCYIKGSDSSIPLLKIENGIEIIKVGSLGGSSTIKFYQKPGINSVNSNLNIAIGQTD